MFLEVFSDRGLTEYLVRRYSWNRGSVQEELQLVTIISSGIEGFAVNANSSKMQVLLNRS